MQRSAIVAEARAWVGTPYRHQASLKGVGSDCLGLVRGVFRAVVGDEPERTPAYSRDWAEAGHGERLAAAARRHLVERPVEAALPGDVVLFRFRNHLPAKHAGILVADDRFVHAYDGAGVVEAELTPWWARRIVFAFAFPGAR